MNKSVNLFQRRIKQKICYAQVSRTVSCVEKFCTMQSWQESLNLPSRSNKNGKKNIQHMKRRFFSQFWYVHMDNQLFIIHVKVHLPSGLGGREGGSLRTSRRSTKNFLFFSQAADSDSLARPVRKNCSRPGRSSETNTKQWKITKTLPKVRPCSHMAPEIGHEQLQSFIKKKF